jgi:CheY-like chemotaxis protein
MNWKSEIAADGYKAVEKFHSGEFDIILMDVQMPHMDGLEATRKIRNIEKSAGLGKTPVIGLTAHSDDSHKIDCYKAGMDYFVTKPYKWEDIYSAILNLTGHPVKSKRAANITKILDSLNKNSKVFAKVRDYFINKYPEELAELDMAITNKDCETAREIAHRIKSEVGNFGAEKAVELAGRIEQAGARKEMNQCKNYLSQLGKEFEKIEKQLTEYKI